MFCLNNLFTDEVLCGSPPETLKQSYGSKEKSFCILLTKYQSAGFKSKMVNVPSSLYKYS
jgi:hypothetical protein